MSQTSTIQQDNHVSLNQDEILGRYPSSDISVSPSVPEIQVEEVVVAPKLPEVAPAPQDQIDGQYKEIDLTNLEGLDDFLTYVEEIYSEVEAVLDSPSDFDYGKFSLDDVSGKEIFFTFEEMLLEIRELIAELRLGLTNNRQGVSDTKVVELQELYDSMVVLRNHIIDSCEKEEDFEVLQLRRKTMEIRPDFDEGNISIMVAEEAEKAIERRSGDRRVFRSVDQRTIDNSLIEPTALVDDQSIIATTEKIDPINNLVASNAFRDVDKVVSKESLTKKYLRDIGYQNFIKSNYNSSSAFDNILNSTIRKIESATEDRFEKWLKVEHKSAFSFIRGLKLYELNELLDKKNLHQILSAENIKYETFLTWIDLLPEMLEVVNPSDEQKIEEIYSRWVIESRMQHDHASVA